MSDLQKQRAAEAALDFVQDGMTLGLGTGSTAAKFLEALGARLRQGLDVVGLPTSEGARRLAEQHQIPLIDADETTVIDVAIDGADEVCPAGDLIKGGGGAHLREKIVASAARRFVVMVDASKRVQQLGAFPLPIEIDPFSWGLTVSSVRTVLTSMGYADVPMQLRSAERGVFMSDGGNYVLDAQLGRIADPDALDRALTLVPGVVCTGLFVGMADIVLVGTDNGVTVTHPKEGQ